MNVEQKANETLETGKPKIERYFNEDGNISFEDIIRSLVQEVIELTIRPSYHVEQVNVATHNKGVA